MDFFYDVPIYFNRLHVSCRTFNIGSQYIREPVIFPLDCMFIPHFVMHKQVR